MKVTGVCPSWCTVACCGICEDWLRYMPHNIKEPVSACVHEEDEIDDDNNLPDDTLDAMDKVTSPLASRYGRWLSTCPHTRCRLSFYEYSVCLFWFSVLLL